MICGDEWKEKLLSLVEARLQDTLKLQFASLDEGVAICLSRIEYCELPSAPPKGHLEHLPVGELAQQARIRQWVERVCQRAAVSEYVQDCERVALYLDVVERLSGTVPRAQPDLDWARELVRSTLKDTIEGLTSRCELLESVLALANQLGHGEAAACVLRTRVKHLPEAFADKARWISDTVLAVEEHVRSDLSAGDAKAIARLVQDWQHELQTRQLFWYRHEPFAERTLRSMLIRRFHKRDVSEELSTLLGQLEEQVAGREAFLSCVRDYRPSAGKPFAGFFDWLIVKRSLDLLRRFHALPERSRKTDLDVVGTPSGNRWADGELATLQTALKQCLAALQRKQRRGNPSWGREARAVFELRHKAYLHPDFVGRQTKEMVVAHLAEETVRAEKLSDDYEQSCQRMEDLETKRLKDMEDEFHRRYAELRRCRSELENSGYASREILRLDRDASARKLADLGAAKRLATSNDRRHELDYMIAAKRFRRAVRKMEDGLSERADWDACRGVWVRTQEEIVALTGLSQSAVSRRLTGAKKFDHRKMWRQKRLAFLVGQFAIDVCSTAIMSNHIRLVVRNRPDIAGQWSDEDVARRW